MKHYLASRYSPQNMASEGFMWKTRRGKMRYGLCSDPVWVPDRRSPVRASLDRGRPSPAVVFPQKHQQPKDFFAFFFHPWKKNVVRHRAANETGLQGRLVRNHPSHYSHERLTILIDSIFFRLPYPTPSVSPANGGGSTFPCQGKDLWTIKGGVVDGKPRYSETYLFHRLPEKDRPLRVLWKKPFHVTPRPHTAGTWCTK